MPDYADISELDQDASKIRVLWSKTINFAASFDREFQDLEERFKAGRYGPEWTFARWLIVKCGLSPRSSYRMIQDFHRLISEDRREQNRRELEEQRKAKAQDQADRRATQLAWNSWLAEETQGRRLTQAAWNGWVAEEKERRRSINIAYTGWLGEERQRIKDEKETERQDKAAEQKKVAARARDRAYKRRKKAEKDAKIKEMTMATLSSDENVKTEIPVPNLSQVSIADWLHVLDAAIDRLVAALDQCPSTERAWIKQRIITRLGLGDDDGSRETGEGVGHARFDA